MRTVRILVGRVKRRADNAGFVEELRRDNPRPDLQVLEPFLVVRADSTAGDDQFGPKQVLDFAQIFGYLGTPFLERKFAPFLGGPMQARTDGRA